MQTQKIGAGGGGGLALFSDIRWCISGPKFSSYAAQGMRRDFGDQLRMRPDRLLWLDKRLHLVYLVSSMTGVTACHCSDECGRSG
jgi:hypothetical protein